MRTRTKKAEPMIPEPPKAEPPKAEPPKSRHDPAAPMPDRNLVVFLGESFAIERTDSINWTAKHRREIDASHHLARGGGHRWEVVGFFSSPGAAFRKLAALMIDNAEATNARVLAERIEALFVKFTPAILLAERAKAIADVAESFAGDTRTKLEAMARDCAERASKVGAV